MCLFAPPTSQSCRAVHFGLPQPQTSDSIIFSVGKASTRLPERNMIGLWHTYQKYDDSYQLSPILQYKLTFILIYREVVLFEGYTGYTPFFSQKNQISERPLEKLIWLSSESFNTMSCSKVLSLTALLVGN